MSLRGTVLVTRSPTVTQGSLPHGLPSVHVSYPSVSFIPQLILAHIIQPVNSTTNRKVIKLYMGKAGTSYPSFTSSRL